MAGGQQGQPEGGSPCQGNGRAASPGPILPSGGGTSPGTAAFGSWREAGSRERPSGVSRWPGGLILWPGGSRGSRRPVPRAGATAGRETASPGPVPDTPSGWGTSPGTAAFGSWRTAGSRERPSGVSRWPDPMAGGQQGQPESGSRCQGNGRAASPGRYPIPPAVGVHHQVQRRSAAGGQQGAGNGPRVSRWPGGLILWPGGSRGSRRPVPRAGATAGRETASPGPVPDTPSGWGTSPGTAAFGSWRTAGSRERPSGVSRWPDPMAGGQQGQPESGSRCQGNGRAASPGRYPIPPAVGVHHQVQRRSAAGGQQGAGNGPRVSRWPGGLILWPGGSRGSRRPVPRARATAGPPAPARYPQRWGYITRNSGVQQLAGSTGPGAALR